MKRNLGFSMLELLVGLLISSILGLAMARLYAISVQNSELARSLQNMNQQIINVSQALDKYVGDMAGFGYFLPKAMTNVNGKNPNMSPAVWVQIDPNDHVNTPAGNMITVYFRNIDPGSGNNAYVDNQVISTAGGVWRNGGVANSFNITTCTGRSVLAGQEGYHRLWVQFDANGNGSLVCQDHVGDASGFLSPVVLATNVQKMDVWVGEDTSKGPGAVNLYIHNTQYSADGLMTSPPYVHWHSVAALQVFLVLKDTVVGLPANPTGNRFQSIFSVSGVTLSPNEQYVVTPTLQPGQYQKMFRKTIGLKNAPSPPKIPFCYQNGPSDFRVYAQGRWSGQQNVASSYGACSSFLFSSQSACEQAIADYLKYGNYVLGGNPNWQGASTFCDFPSIFESPPL